MLVAQAHTVTREMKSDGWRPLSLSLSLLPKSNGKIAVKWPDSGPLKWFREALSQQTSVAGLYD